MSPKTPDFPICNRFQINFFLLRPHLDEIQEENFNFHTNKKRDQTALRREVLPEFCRKNSNLLLKYLAHVFRVGIPHHVRNLVQLEL